MHRLNEEIVACRACPRLVEWRERVAREKRKAYAGQEYWGKPVPNFGDPEADRLIVGLAPAAHGANRTGQMFTGDRSGDWLYRALHKAGVANMPKADSIADGLVLRGVLITATAHCAPPDNKPLPSETSNCAAFLERTLALPLSRAEMNRAPYGEGSRGMEAPRWKAILCLGSIAWDHTFRALGEKRRPFGHGCVEYVRSPSPCGDDRAPEGEGGRGMEVPRIKLVGSYHPSQQNTFTGKLTEEMLDAAIAEWLG